MARSITSIQPTGARYVDGDERPEYVDRPAIIQAVHAEPKATYGPRHVIELAMVDDGELIALAFGDNPTRVAMFTSLAEAIAAEGPEAFGPVCLFMAEPASENGKPYWAFRDATPDEIAAAQAGAAGEAPAEPDPEPAPKGKGK